MAKKQAKKSKLVRASNRRFLHTGPYPGGLGEVKDIRYILWDCNGALPPDTAVYVHMQFQPLDGSNQGKLVDIYWFVGSSALFMPDAEGGFLLCVNPNKLMERPIGYACEWFHVFTALRRLGLKGKELDKKHGIRRLIGCVLELGRMEAPLRGFDVTKRGPSILVPFKFMRGKKAERLKEAVQ